MPRPSPARSHTRPQTCWRMLIFARPESALTRRYITYSSSYGVAPNPFTNTATSLPRNPVGQNRFHHLVHDLDRLGSTLAAACQVRRECPAQFPSHPRASQTWVCHWPARCRRKGLHPSCALARWLSASSATTVARSANRRGLGCTRFQHKEIARNTPPLSISLGGAEATSSVPSTVTTAMPCCASAISAARSKFSTSPA